MTKIYLDNNATTRVAPEVIEAMMADLLSEGWNPSSVHGFGRNARNALTVAHRSIAQILGVRQSELIFTSGGTEGANLVLRGVKKGHVITSNVEHPCVASTLEQFDDVTYLDAGQYGAVSAEQVRQAIRHDTQLIAVMAANNETGVLTDIAAIAAVAEETQIPLFVDGVALLGKEAVAIPHGVSAMSFSGHKIHAPKGIGCLFLRHSLKLQPLITGGHQQYERRGGTENLAGILGLAKALSLPPAYDQMRTLRDRLEEGIMALCPQVLVNGEGPRVSNTSNLYFAGVEGDALLMQLDLAGIAVSHGSACSSGSLEPSRVLLNMGYSRQRAAASLRFSLSRFTSQDEVDHVVEEVARLAGK